MKAKNKQVGFPTGNLLEQYYLSLYSTLFRSGQLFILFPKLCGTYETDRAEWKLLVDYRDSIARKIRRNNLNLKKMNAKELLAYERTIKIVNGRADKTQLAVYMATYNDFTDAEKREYNDLKLTYICSLPCHEPQAIGATEAEYCS